MDWHVMFVREFALRTVCARNGLAIPLNCIVGVCQVKKRIAVPPILIAALSVVMEVSDFFPCISCLQQTISDWSCDLGVWYCNLLSKLSNNWSNYIVQPSYLVESTRHASCARQCYCCPASEDDLRKYPRQQRPGSRVGIQSPPLERWSSAVAQVQEYPKRHTPPFARERTHLQSLYEMLFSTLFFFT